MQDCRPAKKSNPCIHDKSARPCEIDGFRNERWTEMQNVLN